jgi:hypothetical protein
VSKFVLQFVLSNINRYLHSERSHFIKRSLSLSGSFPETLFPVAIVEPMKALLVTICTCTTHRTAAKQDYYHYHYILLSNRTSKQKIRTAHISLPEPLPLLRKTIYLPRAKGHYNIYRRYEE